MTSQLSIALRAAAAGIHPDEAAAGLIIGHAAFLQRGDFTRHIETAACASDGTPMTWIDWDAVITALDGGRLPASGGEKRIIRIAASLAAGHPRQPPRRHPRPRPAQPGAGHHRHPPRRWATPVNISLDDATVQIGVPGGPPVDHRHTV